MQTGSNEPYDAECQVSSRVLRNTSRSKVVARLQTVLLVLGLQFFPMCLCMNDNHIDTDRVNQCGFVCAINT